MEQSSETNSFMLFTFFLGSDSIDALHKTLSKSSVAIIFDNIKQLELNNLDIAHSPNNVNKRSLVTGLIFRSVDFSRALYE